MRFRVKYKLDITIADKDRITPAIKKKEDLEKFLGKPIVLVGTKEQIKEKLNAKLDELTSQLIDWYYGE